MHRKRLNILVITQNDPFYLPTTVASLLKSLSQYHKVVGLICLDGDPFGQKLSILRRFYETFSIFGAKFTLRYSLEFIFKKVFFRASVQNIVRDLGMTQLPVIGPINSKKNLDLIREVDPDLIISLTANQIFKRDLLSIPKYGCINLHTSQLPSYRGIMPTFWALYNDEKRTGVSVFMIDDGIDTGPIIKQEIVEINNRSHRDLILKTKRLGVKLLLEAVENIATGAVAYIENKGNQASYYGKPTRDDVRHFIKKGKRFF
ncbi:formyltransferase family protein [Planktomarina temperata]|nr:formyltransferase family protein [Planktomarina temperata]